MFHSTNPMRGIALMLFMVFAAVWSGVAQTPSVKKHIGAVRAAIAPRIDGVLDDTVWLTAPPATGFTQIEPYNGRPASQPSVVCFVYDDDALYIGAMLYDSAPDSILKEMTVRDETANCDYFGVRIDPYNDALVSYGFAVTAAGVQIDIKNADGDDDYSWDAVWTSAVKITSRGWIAEMKIPYSALRFPENLQGKPWGLNIFRLIRRYREELAWNPVDKKVAGLNTQEGELDGISHIHPPVRLALIPYVSGYLNKDPNETKWGYLYKGGMDLKYGISDSYTLDMVLIPDFGQVQSDEDIFNLTPFEVYYGEKRPFFMEGTELFNKGNVFYSRRVGARPSHYEEVNSKLDTNEIVVKNPEETQLINATKITGKNRKGLAIGVFNAMTANTYARIKDTVTGKERKLLTQPFANYNMLVFQQSLKNNSYVSLFNTNVYKPKEHYSANVTGCDMKLINRKNTYGVGGDFILSQKYNASHKPVTGYDYQIEAGKISGNFTFNLVHHVITDTYDPNDLGFLTHNNEMDNGVEVSYNIYTPFWRLLEWHNSLTAYHTMLYSPRKYADCGLEYNTFLTFKNYLSMSMEVYYRPVDEHDYYEPRVEGWYYSLPPVYSVVLWISPDYRKRFIADVSGSYYITQVRHENGYSGTIAPRLRFTDRLFVLMSFEYQRDNNNKGHVTDSTGHDGQPVIIFGERDLSTVTVSVSPRYIFSPTASLTLRLRHYWIKGIYHRFYDLQRDGSITPNGYNNNEDFAFNAFTVDMDFAWQFAPGSELSVVWKNAIDTYEEQEVTPSYFGSLHNTLSSPATNSFSVKILYYIDYQSLKKNKKRIANSC